MGGLLAPHRPRAAPSDISSTPGSLRIIHVLTRLLPAGTEENTISLALRQKNEGHDVTIIFGRDFNPDLRASVSRDFSTINVSSLVHRISPFSDLRALLVLRNLFSKAKPDLVHTHQSKAGILACAAASIVGVKGIVHGVHILPWVNSSKVVAAAYIAIERYCARFATAYIDVSAGVRDQCLKHGIGEREQHFVAKSPIDLARFRNAHPANDILPRRVGADPIVVLMLAAFEPRKRQEAFIRALSKVEFSKTVMLLFAGSGPTMLMAKDAADRYLSQIGVEFLGHRADPEALINLADVCVLTSSREGLPRVLLQYLAGGRAAVVTRLPGLEDVITDNHNAIIVDTVDQAAFEIARLVNDDEARSLLAKGARETPLEDWELDQSYPVVMEAYAYALGNRKLRR